MYNIHTIRRCTIAKIIDSNIESQPVNNSYAVWRIASVGVILGILYWCLTAAMSRYTSSINIAGDISSILIATVGIAVMLSLHMTRPLLVALASVFSLWGLAQMTEGLMWFEIIIWNALLYGLAYTLFSWIARYKQTVPVLIVITAIIVILRITITP